MRRILRACVKDHFSDILNCVNKDVNKEHVIEQLNATDTTSIEPFSVQEVLEAIDELTSGLSLAVVMSCMLNILNSLESHAPLTSRYVSL